MSIFRKKYRFLLVILVFLIFPSFLFAKEEKSSSLQRKWVSFQEYLKDVFAPRYQVEKNFFGLHYKSFVLGNTLRFKDEDFSTSVSEINSNFNAWGVFYVNFHNYLRTHFAVSSYEYVKLNYSYKPNSETTTTVSQIKLNEGDFSLAYVVYVNENLPVYAGGGLTAGHIKIQNTIRSREKTIGYIGGKIVLGTSYIYDETLYIDTSFYSLPLALNQGYATTLSVGLAF